MVPGLLERVAQALRPVLRVGRQRRVVEDELVLDGLVAQAGELAALRPGGPGERVAVEEPHTAGQLVIEALARQAGGDVEAVGEQRRQVVVEARGAVQQRPQPSLGDRVVRLRVDERMHAGRQGGALTRRARRRWRPGARRRPRGRAQRAGVGAHDEHEASLAVDREVADVALVTGRRRGPGRGRAAAAWAGWRTCRP